MGYRDKKQENFILVIVMNWEKTEDELLDSIYSRFISDSVDFPERREMGEDRKYGWGGRSRPSFKMCEDHGD